MTTAGYIIENVFVVTIIHDPYGCCCDVVEAVFGTKAAAEEYAKVYEQRNRGEQAIVTEMEVQ